MPAPASFDSSSPAKNPWKLGGLSWRELGRRLWREVIRDELIGRGAQLAFYFLLALFPALLFLTALLGLLPGDIMVELITYLRRILPREALSIVQKYLEKVVMGSGGDILSLGLLGALWVSSSGVTAIMDALNAVYGVKESRPRWKVRLIAIAITVGLAGFIILSISLVLYGEYIAEWIAGWFGLGGLFTIVWIVLQWPLVIGLMSFAMAVVYYFSPNVTQNWRWVTPGSVFAVTAWMIVSLLFKLYAENFGDYNAVYGSIAGVIVLMLWFYLNGTVLLIGGEINAEIEKAGNERAKARGERQPMQRRASRRIKPKR